jgi:hypothetical protein
LDVNGDINFNGVLFQSGSRYVSSQWTTTTTTPSRIFITNSNVGIGTTNPLTTLHVVGTTSTSNIGIGTTVPLQALHVVNASYFQGNVGIGTTIPEHGLHVQSPSSFISGNLGIGTTIPQFRLHVNGNLNFDGDLFQSGSRYISSQWTTAVTGNNTSVYIANSNVGIGTSTPLYGLHVEPSCFFGSNVIFNSNVTVNGLLSTRGNIASISDQKVKTNLAVIDNAVGRIEQLSGYTYDRTDVNRREAGLIAQEVQQVLPEVVHYTPEHDMLTISYGNMAGLFVEAFKQLQAEVRSLQEEVAFIRSNISRI